MKRIGFVASLLLKATVLVLLVLTPIAISFKPYYTPERPSYPAVFDDPQYLLKAFFIATGLIGGTLVVVLVVLYLIFGRPYQKSQLVLHFCITICAVALGWHVLPYCANGIFQASIGNADFGDFDPKNLMPTIWIGETWLDIALLLYPVLFVGGFILISMTIIMASRKHFTKSQLAQISMFLILTVLAFVLFPEIANWIMD